MNQTPLLIGCASLAIILVGTSVITDLLWRRIPNYLTLPAFAIALILRAVFQGWSGVGLALGGAVLAPFLLYVTHGGKGIGMGDLKLAAALGAILGPILAAVAMLISLVVGGLLAIFYMLLPGGMLNQLISTLSIGLPFQKKKGKCTPEADTGPAIATMPYGLAIGSGSLITLAVCWWTGNETWFFSFVGIVAKL
jgi:prepilin peptidase CpaA